MNLRFIVMTAGYAESATVSTLIYQCNFFGKSGYTSYKEAITDLALDVFHKFKEHYTFLKFNMNEFTDYVLSLYGAIADTYGDAEWAEGRQLTWWPYWNRDFIGAPKEDVIYIGEHGEHLVLSALLEAMPELMADIDEDELSGENNSDWESFKNNIQPHFP